MSLKTKDKLPTLTPPEVIKWVENIEEFAESNLCGLPKDATLEQIKDTFYSDRDTLMGMAQVFFERARYNAWGDYEDRLEFGDD